MAQFLRLSFLLTSLVAWNVDGSSSDSSFETVETSNAAIFNRLGLVPLEIPIGHHKKRLAGPEPPGLSGLQSRIHQPYSRRHGHHDSHVYVVKLPASPPYYSVTKPHKSVTKDDKILLTKNIPGGGASSSSSSSSLDSSHSSVIHQSPGVDFHNNGKPAKISHWNLPLIKKITEKKRLYAQYKMEQMKKKFETENLMVTNKEEINQVNNSQILIPSTKHFKKSESIKHFNPNNAIINDDKSFYNKHTRYNDKRLKYPDITSDNDAKHSPTNNDLRKMYRLDSTLYRIENNRPNNHLSSWSSLSNDINRMNLQKGKKHRKKAAMTYYAPIMDKSGPSNIQKNFAGNGKPKAFYVMEKSRKPVYHHPLLP